MKLQCRTPHFFHIGCAVALAASLTLGSQVERAAATDKPTFRDFPYLVYCQYMGIDHAYYFSRLGDDGVAVYLTPDSLAGMISIEGVARRVGGDTSGTCRDKTIDELRSAGQAFDLPR